jgi:hypothetical protein
MLGKEARGRWDDGVAGKCEARWTMAGEVGVAWDDGKTEMAGVTMPLGWMTVRELTMAFCMTKMTMWMRKVSSGKK